MAREQLPSVRNQQIFGEVRYQHRPLRAVAHTYDVSPARVGEIVEQVEAWLKQSTPRWMSVADRQQQVLAVYRQHCDRLESMCGALAARASVLLSEDESETIRTQSGEKCTVTRRGPQLAAQRLYLTAMQLSREQFEATIALAQLELAHPDVLDAASMPPTSVLAQETTVEPEVAATPCHAPAANDEAVVSCAAEPVVTTVLNEPHIAPAAPWRVRRQEQQARSRGARQPQRAWLAEAIADEFNERPSPFPR